MLTKSCRPKTRTGPLRLPTLPSVVLAAFVVLIGGVAGARADCRLEEPRFEGTGAEAKVVLSVACVEGEQPGYVSYPDGPLYFGMSIFALGDERAETSAEAMGSEHNIEAVEIDNVGSGADVTLPLGPLDRELTHYVVAVWAEVTECAFVAAERCFGPYDDFLYPIPVDTWPKPACDVEALRSIGYFDWTSSPEVDPSGFQAPPEVQEVFSNVDCFREQQTDYGFGLSLKSWRVAPLPGRPG